MCTCEIQKERYVEKRKKAGTKYVSDVVLCACVCREGREECTQGPTGQECQDVMFLSRCM